MTPPINRQELVMGRMGLNVLSGMSGGAIFLLLLAELIRQQQRNERKGWGR
jgi:hypothetical protein